jgi:hypothetical protein
MSEIVYGVRDRWVSGQLYTWYRYLRRAEKYRDRLWKNGVITTITREPLDGISARSGVLVMDFKTGEPRNEYSPTSGLSTVQDPVKRTPVCWEVCS